MLIYYIKKYTDSFRLVKTSIIILHSFSRQASFCRLWKSIIRF